MATPRQLVKEGKLIDLSEGLAPDELPQRELYAFPDFETWYNDELPKIKPWRHGPGRIDPLGQVDDLLHRFLMGLPFDSEFKSKCLEPKPKGIWELKTTDVRAFGWFWRPDTYILYRAVDASWVKNTGTYNGFILETEWNRAELDLDEPEFIVGGYENVFQI